MNSTFHGILERLTCGILDRLSNRIDQLENECIFRKIQTFEV